MSSQYDAKIYAKQGKKHKTWVLHLTNLWNIRRSSLKNIEKFNWRDTKYNIVCNRSLIVQIIIL